MYNPKSRNAQSDNPDRKTPRRWRRGATQVPSAGKTRGQAVVEMALASVMLALLLAAAIDLGRAYYTSVVVTNMAGEGALFASEYPDLDATLPAAGACSQLGVNSNKNIQNRARQIATERGLVIKQPSQSNIRIEPTNCALRCDGRPITVTVSYRLDDLFLPGLIGTDVLTITKSSSMRMTTDSWTGRQLCPAP